MSFYSGTQAEVLPGGSGPPSNYAAAAASSAAAQNLMTGASGDYVQPYIPAFFFQMGRTGQLVTGRLNGILSGQSSATTAIITLAYNSSSNSISGATTLVATPAITVTSFATVGWQWDFTILCRGVGYGTSATSTSLLSSATMAISSPYNSATTTSWVAVAPPNSVTALDCSVNNWLVADVTFSTSSTTNSCTLESYYVCGMN